MSAPGSSARRDTVPFFWCIVVFSSCLLLAGRPAIADPEVDTDLVFDSLDSSSTNDNHPRIRKAIESSHPIEEEYWLTSTVNRIKRSIGHLFSSKDDSSKTAEHINHSTSSESNRKRRVQRQLGNEIGQQEEDNYERSSRPGSNTFGFPLDDEDSLDVNSGVGSGEVTVPETGSSTTPSIIDYGHPQVYRFTFTVIEPYVNEFNDRNSREFQDFASGVKRAIEDLYQYVQGDQSATVISVQNKSSDNFKVRVTVDVESTNVDSDDIRETLYDQIERNHRIGSYTATLEDFYFREFADSSNKCEPRELQCRSGQCVPADVRCNGVRDCNDNSDEEGCIREEPEIPVGSTVKSFEVGNIPFSTTPSPSSSTTEFLDVGSGDDECRADDAYRCPDGSRTICEDQRCDGRNDCNDGSDEANCGQIHECAVGEFKCDVSRCIPVGQRCDGTIDCSDGTDEHNCPVVCEPDQIRCDDRCISSDRRCNGISDCLDGNDERDCPELQRCYADDFNCADPHQNPNCIPFSRVCDNRPDCPDGRDELNCTSISHECRPGQFTCHDGQCVPFSAKCDRIYDCRDLSDERNCPCLPTDFRCNNDYCIPQSQRCDVVHHCQDGSDEIGCTKKCKSNEWRCGDGTCIDRTFRCNLVYNCPDRSDEVDCHARCMPDQYRCNDGTCLSLSKICDGVEDCLGSEDESSCAHACTPEDFTCSNGQCIPVRLLCNGSPDCSDSSDERNCIQENGCHADQYRCAEGICIEGYKRCNVLVDCESGSDEENCPSTTTGSPYTPDTACTTNEFQCVDGICIDYSYYCDGIPDCYDRSDETYCDDTYNACREDEVRCRDGTCAIGRKCDGTYDCVDASDELNCTGRCQISEFQCVSNGACIDERLRCDGLQDCRDGSDEENCVTSCPADQFRCTDGLCLDGRRRCDGIPDCSDGSDEYGCEIAPTNASLLCGSEQFHCGGTQCIDKVYQCDGIADCDNKLDELDCPESCTADEFECESDKFCIPLSMRCNGNSECNDNSDELNCSPVRCSSSQLRCNDGSCIDGYRQCDGYQDCPDGSDEAGCPACNEPEWFQCYDGACISATLRCDNFYDCKDFSDEQSCFACRGNQFQCSSDGRCIDINLRCNNVNECIDGSDEYNCPTSPPPTRPEPIPGAVSCPYGHVACRSLNQCIRNEQLCDGTVDCNDLSDETNCPRPLLRTYPDSQEQKEQQDVVFTCRDEGPIRARVHWERPNGQPLPPGSTDIRGRLEIPKIQMEHAGTYLCVASGYPANTPGAQVSVDLRVLKREPRPYIPSTPACGLLEATCSNGDCIPKHKVCDGVYDCADGSDENRCNPNGCEPNEFQCSNKKCVLKTWRCDSDDDCGDNSDEIGCSTNPPGSQCQYHQFACHSGNQCIPRSYHCDMERDCIDGSDEIGCSKPVISQPPPPMIHLQIGETFEIMCTAVGIPTPEIVWRKNWGHIPAKCRTTSDGGVGTLICENIQEEDQGAYSCEAINIKGATFAVPDTILVVDRTSVCPAGYFNTEARIESECIKCFCFGHTSSCQSADLFIFQFQPPFSTLKILGVHVDPITGVVDIRDEPIFRGTQPVLSPSGPNGVYASVPQYSELFQSNVVPYFAMPESYHGNQLKSYGGHLRYTIRHSDRGAPIPGPNVIISGNGYTLLHESRYSPAPNTDEHMDVRFFTGDWTIKSAREQERIATREEIMMVLEDVDNILIKLQYNEGTLNTTLNEIELDSAAAPNSGLGAAVYVEQCSCPTGYTGNSCERCEAGYVRHLTGPWLGQCYRSTDCQPGQYFDGRQCQECPCPHTTPPNQFAQSCQLGPDGDVICNCPSGYVGNRCQSCAPGYEGNPLVTGDYCRPASRPPPPYCDPIGSADSRQDSSGRCRCKELVEGPTCSQCRANTFALDSKNQFGCIPCFCMGVSQQCSSSDWYRDQISNIFTSSTSDFKIVDNTYREVPISEGIFLNKTSQEISYSGFATSNAYYWSLPSIYLGNKITSYGGYLRYTLRHSPVPGGQSSRNAAADIELVSKNNINLLFFNQNQSQPTNAAQTFVVPLLEQYWQRSDGQVADREHLLMVLADLEAIYIKATYYTNTRESSLISVSLDIANERNTGSLVRALEVEQCHCPIGYVGLSCEDCDIGYARTPNGIYLGLCEPCSCNGHSNECDAESGLCINCRDHTTGDYCDRCLPGYVGDPTNGQPCTLQGNMVPCNCDPRGSVYNECTNGRCTCKVNVEGNYCDRCRPGTFGLSTGNIEGCESCFCSGVATDCIESNLYILQIPIQISPTNHGFTLTDQYHNTRITDDFRVDVTVNEISHSLSQGNNEVLYWSLPSVFTGNKIKSYGGNIEFSQRYSQSPLGRYIPDRDIIILGNGITLFWSNPREQVPDTTNTISVTLSPNSGWYRIDQNSGPRPASREDLLITLANIDSILIRATLSSDTTSTHLSDIALDTAVDQQTGLAKATNVEACRCPPGYRGSSCESCASGYYKDLYFDQSKPLGTCSRCPCNNREVSCQMDPDRRINCNCLPSYAGEHCEFEAMYIEGFGMEFKPENVMAPIGTQVQFTCKYWSREKNYKFNVESLNVHDKVYKTYPGGAQVSFYHVVSCNQQTIRCAVSNDDGYEVGFLNVMVYPAGNFTTTPYPDIPTTGPPATIEVAIENHSIGIYEVGSTVRFNCSARSRVPSSNIRIHWSKAGGDLPSHAIDDGRGLLVITNLKVTDSGRYVCEATDSYTISTSSVDLNVGDRGDEIPRVAVSQKYVEVDEGQPIEVRCAANGFPAPELRVVRLDGQPLSLLTNGIFRISQARRSDSGDYECVASNRKGEVSARFQIIVRHGGELLSLQVEPAYYNGTSGDRVILRCHTSSDSPNIRWSKDGGSLPFDSRSEGDMFIINSALPEDSGTYTCLAESRTGQTSTARARVSITGSNAQWEYPTAKVTPERIFLSEGRSTELYCSATGIPPPTIKWTKLNADLGPNTEQIGSTLYIRDAIVDDRGIYVCVSTNGHGIAQASVLVEVTRLEIPRLEIYPKSTQIVTAGNSAIVQCRAVAGIPSPTITWRRANDVPLSSNTEEMSGGTLRFTGITREEEGEYICTGSNEAGTVTAIASIVVHTIPELYIVPNQDIVNKYVGESLRLECQGSGIPQPTVTWVKYGVSYGYSESDLPIAQPQNLAVQEFNRISRGDSGLYICRGENSAGVVEKRVQLVVDTLPERGDITGTQSRGEDATSGNPKLKSLRPEFDETYTAPVGTRAEIRCHISYQSQGPGIEVKWIRTDNSSLPPDAYERSGTLYIDNVQPSAEGNYRCLGIDQATGSVLFHLNTYLNVVSPPRITLNPPRQIVRPGENAFINCTATGRQPITLFWSATGRNMPASVYTQEGYIRFNNIQLQDAGRYLCRARNIDGEADGTADVIVEDNYSQPAIKAEQKRQIAPLGSDVTLRCKATNPNARSSIRWFRENLPLKQGAQIRGEVLFLPNAQLQDQGKYYCELAAKEGTFTDYVDLIISGPERGPTYRQSRPVLNISPSERDYHSGENVDIICHSSERGVITSWSKVGGWLQDNVQTSGGTLRIIHLRPDNAGIYRCEATGDQGIYSKDYNVSVVEEARDEPPLRIKRAPRGKSVRLECNTNLDEPVTYLWTKQGGNLPRSVDIYSKDIELYDIGSADAGTYTCSASSGVTNINVPIILVVTGIVPYFTQAPNSYVALPTLGDSYMQFSFEISFKPENGNGLILYNGNRGDRILDFISLALVNSIPEFKINLGHTTTIIKADRPITNRQWHTVKVVRNKKKVTMYVDSDGPFIETSDGKYIGLDLTEPLYLGGVPDPRAISSDVFSTTPYIGFVGCISRLKIGHSHMDIFSEMLNETGITTCETCSESQCENQGACQEALSKEGYICICPSGFSGPTCNKLKGEACSPYACGVGRCIDTDNGFECQCPLGRAGRRCEKEIIINEPAFQNDAYIAYPTPKPSRILKITMKIKPNTEEDGILFYCGETEEGHGDFLSLSIRNKRLEFKFDAGNGVAVITQDEDLVPNQWHILTVTKSLSNGRLTVDGKASTGRLVGNHKTLSLHTPLYVGGYDKHTIKVNNGVHVDSGFNGCISDIHVSGVELNIIQNATDSSNVVDCSEGSDVDNNVYQSNYASENELQPIPYNKQTGCSSNPCLHGGQCYPLSPIGYECLCPPRFTGKSCETSVNLCDDQPCLNRGQCKSNNTHYSCDCTLGYFGYNCEQRVELHNDAHFEGNGYLEFSRSLLDHQIDDEQEIIALEISTNSSNGLIFWHGQTPDQDGQGQDYIALAIENGYLEYSFDLGMGPAIIRSSDKRVDDGEQHTVILKREGKKGTMEIDNDWHTVEGEAEGYQTAMTCNGNIYIGGTPNISRMTGGRFTQGFRGCIHGFEVQNSHRIDLGLKAINGLNVKPCSSPWDFHNSIPKNQ